jgi:hypothetical protein
MHVATIRFEVVAEVLACVGQIGDFSILSRAMSCASGTGIVMRRSRRRMRRLLGAMCLAARLRHGLYGLWGICITFRCLCLVLVYNSAEQAKRAAYGHGPVQDFSVQARTKAWLEGMALAAGLATHVGMCIESPELLLPRLMHVSALRAKRKAEKNAALAALIGSGCHSSDGADAMDLSDLLETGSDDVIAAVACAAGVFDTPKVVDEAVSAALTKDLADMVRRALGPDGDDLVVSEEVLAPPDPEPGLSADTAGGSGDAVSGSKGVSDRDPDEKSTGTCSCVRHDAHQALQSYFMSSHGRCVCLVLRGPVPKNMRVHYTDDAGNLVEVDKRHLVATLVAFGAVGGKLSADKQTRIKQAAGMREEAALDCPHHSLSAMPSSGCRS